LIELYKQKQITNSWVKWNLTTEILITEYKSLLTNKISVDNEFVAKIFWVIKNFIIKKYFKYTNIS